MRDNEFTKILGWPGYRVYRHEIDEAAKRLRLWVRRNESLARRMITTSARCETYRGEYRTTVIIEVYRVCCPNCGIRVEKVPQLPSKAPFSKRFEEAVGQACESASVRQMARQFGLAASTVRAIDLRYLKRWSATRRKDGLEQMGVDEIYFGQQMKFITVVSNLETGEPLWFGQDRKQETLDEFFRTQRLRTPISSNTQIAAGRLPFWSRHTHLLSARRARSHRPLWVHGRQKRHLQQAGGT